MTDLVYWEICSMGSGNLALRVIQPEREADHAPSYSDDFKIALSISELPLYAYEQDRCKKN
jgi:hypothetical protein